MGGQSPCLTVLRNTGHRDNLCNLTSVLRHMDCQIIEVSVHAVQWKLIMTNPRGH